MIIYGSSMHGLSRYEASELHECAADAGFLKLLDEVKISTKQITDLSSYQPFPSSLLSADSTVFDNHLRSRADAITATLGKILSNDQSTAADTSAFQEQLARLQLEQKEHANELEKARMEKAQLEERLETASMRYMVAEKKFDRAKSQSVQKLERQAIAGGRSEAGSGLGGATESGQVKTETTNGQVDNEDFAEADKVKKEALAASAKQAEQIEQLAGDNDKLHAQITSLQLRLSSLSDEDYAQSVLFKQLKNQHENVVAKLDGYEATNEELQNEVQKLKEERISYQRQLDAETQAAISEKDLALAKAEHDLTRIRTTRDELTADLQMRKASQEQDKGSSHQAMQLLAAKDDRITDLESQLEALGSSLMESGSDLESLSVEDLRGRCINLERQVSMLNQELSSMSAAYRKMSSSASQKLSNASELEERTARLSAEKAKADQKYFAAMKNKDAREQEIRTLRAQNAKSSEIVSQLKDAEASTSAMVALLEKQVAESRSILVSLEAKHHAVQGQVREKNILAEGLQKQLDELKTNMSTKDTACSAAMSGQRKAEIEVERLKIEIEDKDKRLDMWKSKGLGSVGSENEEALRVRHRRPFPSMTVAKSRQHMVLCSVCQKNFKDTVLKSCGHVLCHGCVDERVQHRMRKCPLCSKGFGTGDHMRIVMN